MSDNGAQSLKSAEDNHNDDRTGRPSISGMDVDTAWVEELSLVNQGTLWISPIPLQQESINGYHEWEWMKQPNVYNN
jgi:hypothetical protein